uniref:Integrase catalytic domain-containing protein n=1 Tax=Vitis vinifera TaxID=29760 RepID=A5BL06_VITVI|nr:hypothetical protein VITISV_038719 [Vitis vinifera]
MLAMSMSQIEEIVQPGLASPFDLFGVSVIEVKEEIQKQLSVGFLSVVEYLEWLANVVLVPKNDGKVRVCVDFRNLNKIFWVQSNSDGFRGHGEDVLHYRVRKLSGYIVSERGIEVDPNKIQAIIDMLAPRTERDIRGFLGRLQYINRVIAKLTNICWRMYFDDAANHSGYGICVLLISPHGDHIPRYVRLAFSNRHSTMNNIVAHEVCILGLETALELGIRQMEVFGDSDSVLRQIQGEWKTRDMKLRPYHAYLELLVGRFDDLRYTHLPRAHNQFANALATLASMIDIPVDELMISPNSSSGHEFILVAIDYFTKWVEAASYARLTLAGVSSFIRSHIICLYEVSHELISDRGLHFRAEVDTLLQRYGIQHRRLFVYRLQTNGVVEVANKNIKRICRRMVETSRDWSEKLLFALWAYRTSFHTSTGATPYSLVYGMEAVLLVEIEMDSLRITLKQQIPQADWSQA